MGEGVLAGILGEEGEKPEVEAPEALAAAEAFAAAVAAKLAGNDPGVARSTEAFLIEQTELLKVQKEHLKDEHEVRLHYLRGQAREVDIRRFGLRLRVGFQLLVLLFATAIGTGLVVMFSDAVASRNVVIDPFDAPPALATSGMSGKVIAAGLLDVLTQIQAANHTEIMSRNLANAWTSEITIEVPETGVSIAQIERMLKSRFGHDQHIEGELVQTESGGLALTVRGTGILPKTFTDDGRHPERLTTDAGEYLYGQSQPGLWAFYLADHGRNDEAIRFAQESYASADDVEKVYLQGAWAYAVIGKGGESAMREALPVFRESARLKPDLWPAWGSIMWALSSLGDEEGVLPVAKQMMKAAGGRPGRAPESTYENYDATVWDLPALRSEMIAHLEARRGIGPLGSATNSENLSIAQIEIQMHDDEAAVLRLQMVPVDANNASDVSMATMDRALVAEETGNIKIAAEEWDLFAVAYSNPAIATGSPANICYAAVTYQKSGQPAKADAALRPFGNFTFVDCERFQGDVLDLRGDWPGAEKWYSKAVKLGPSIPSGYYSWGMALAKHGDLDGATQKFKDANQKGPHWADPLKAWGDVLVKQTNTKDALAKYDEALKYAPNWKQLKAAREALAKHQGN